MGATVGFQLGRAKHLIYHLPVISGPRGPVVYQNVAERWGVATCPEAKAFHGRHVDYDRACKLAGVPLEEVGAVCVVEVRVLRNYWTGLPNLHDVWRWRRVEDLKTGDDFRALWQYGYDRAGDRDFDRRYTDSRDEAQIYRADSDAFTTPGDRMSTGLTVARI